MEKAFQEMIAGAPLDAGPRLVHADYLEEKGIDGASERNVGALLVARSYAVQVNGKIKAIAHVVSYRGREADIRPALSVELFGTYWDEGSRYTYHRVMLSDLSHRETFPQLNPPQFGGPTTTPVITLDSESVIVRTGTSRGRDAGMDIFGLPDVCALLATVETHNLTREQKIVLSATRSLKSSYAGISNYRFHEAHQKTGIDLATWGKAKAELIGLGHLNRAGAITTQGRNAIGNIDLFSLRS